ncbi:4Fe-4S dicluster domain-containing protein [Clostridium sp.]|uniref:4Fe-4S dicluster domain-containing protein n=1 Tax=Clostridium sp. TaxID=1506 RepID=UPI001A5BE2AF|nr:4Fe-4S dicluster domain-containing protein [Clostridium sp.]MBK5242275.1 4Fe-4S dicluster domain-containing protein [Clostridium sp.]
MYTLKKEDLKELLNTWSKSSFDVYSPQKNEGQVMLLPYGDDELCLDYINFPFPVKEFLFKQKEKLFQWKINNSGVEVHEDETPRDKSILFGIRSCDAYGIAYMDKFFLEDYEDALYKKNREATWIVAMNCVSVGDDCFCSSMGTGPFARVGYDILFTPLEHEYLVEIGSAKGEELILLGENLFTAADNKLLIEKDKLTEATSDKFKTKIKVNNIAKVLQDNFNDPLWNQLSKDCVLCTGCTNICPTCTCFNVVEENISCDSGCRVRCYDSCQSDSFTRNAGEHNPRNDVSRVRYRLFDKFKYIEEKFNMKGCSGCGRCTAVCPASINVVNVINELSERSIVKEDNNLVETNISIDHADKDIVYSHPKESCESTYVPQIAIITDIIQETKTIKRFFLQYEDKSLHENFKLSGQFFEITVFGVGEIAISIPFSPSQKHIFDFCIKKAGKVTNVMHQMKIGDKVGLRGPFGKGFPYAELKGRNVLIIGSGVGIAPVRTFITHALENTQDFGKIVIIGSSMTYEDMIYKDDLIAWSNTLGVKVLYALSSPTTKVHAHVGYINDLLPDLELDFKNTSAIICASPRRIKALAKDLIKLGMSGTDIYTSLETHMRCGIGKCGHCKVGNKYMCIDGPVFNYEEMLTLPPEF